MLEHLPAWLGAALGRAGADTLVVAQIAPAGTARLRLDSPAFADGARLPVRFTADGEGVSPPLAWPAPPAGTTRLALIVEDADAPTPQPLVHAIVWNLYPEAGGLAEGDIRADGGGDAEGDIGRNSFLREGWLPPDPPAGHGAHHYVFQLFALDAAGDDVGASPGRGGIVAAMRGHVLAVGVLTGTYSRGEPAAGPVGGAAQPA